ncbi:MAG: hypothetical protein ACLGQH_04440 [Acidobacteriota bacterium]
MPKSAVTFCPCRFGFVFLLAVVILLAARSVVVAATDDVHFEDASAFEALAFKAESGDASAQCELGVAYLNGQNTSQDFQKGLAWLTRSSDAGYGYARFVLADVYSRGYAGVPVNDELAYYYASLAAASSTLVDKYRNRAGKLRDASAKRLSTAQLTALQAKAALAPLDAAVGY